MKKAFQSEVALDLTAVWAWVIMVDAAALVRVAFVEATAIWSSAGRMAQLEESVPR